MCTFTFGYYAFEFYNSAQDISVMRGKYVMAKVRAIDINMGDTNLGRGDTYRSLSLPKFYFCMQCI